jgi:outer membrane protein OmpA-like peptidoglycan-associated protein
MNHLSLTRLSAAVSVWFVLTLPGVLVAEQPGAYLDCRDRPGSCSEQEVEKALTGLSGMKTGFRPPQDKPADVLPQEKPAVVVLPILFEWNKATLRSKDLEELNKVGRALTRHPDLRLEIHGHTDDTGTEVYNQQLSEARAASVKRYLTQSFPSINAANLMTMGHGESTPKFENGTPDGREKNRRVEFIPRP